MRTLATIAVGLGLIICHTSLIPRLPFVGVFFDPLLPLVVFLAVFRPPREALPTALFLGFLVDSLSGGAFGIHLSAYFWIALGVRQAAAVVHAENPFMLILLLIAAVAAENALVVAVVAASAARPVALPEALRAVTEQIGWVLLTGPFIAALMRRAGRNRPRPRRAEPAPAPNGG
jgi:rod shape-determining protein MreD